MPLIKADNININYDTYGDGEPLLLIMGFGMSGGWMDSVAAVFQRLQVYLLRQSRNRAQRQA